MIITAWRIYEARHRATAFTGRGSECYGGRWNSPGTALVYTAGSAALAELDCLAHLNCEASRRRYILRPLKFPERLVLRLTIEELPRNWRKSPSPVRLRKIGDAWADRLESAVLAVPSAIVPQETNYLLNPAHPDFKKVELGEEIPHRFDPRLFA
jgi:RES domain-containing protein